MFGGAEHVRFRSRKSEDRIDEVVEDALSTLGDVRITKRGDIDIEPRSAFRNTFAEAKFSGRVRRRKGDQYDVEVNYTCTLTQAGWLLCILGFLFFLIGPLILIAPFTMKGDVANRVRRALRDLEDEDE